MPDLSLDTSVRFLRGVGPIRERQLAQCGLLTVWDLLLLSPIRYQHLPRYKPIDQWQEDEWACIAGEIASIRRSFGKNRPNLIATISDGHDRCQIVWFNSAYLIPRLQTGMCLVAIGKLQLRHRLPQMTNPHFRLYQQANSIIIPQQESWRPVYPSLGNFRSPALEQAINSCYTLLDQLIDYLPTSLCQKGNLLPLADALKQLHRPQSLEQAENARRRLAFDELLLGQIKFIQARQNRSRNRQAPVLPLNPKIDQHIRRRLPFELTSAQNAAILEITADLAKTQPMSRLLQGDVGSGKTAVAVYAALVAIANHHQVALLAPTEILAQQHGQRISQYLSNSNVKIALLLGSTSQRQRKIIQTELANGQIHWIIGTHALLQPHIRFQKLGLVIIDEQHRFGVQQRLDMMTKGHSPHYLVLSATPIPRTQALAFFGDLDISTIKTPPVGRGKIQTRIIHNSLTPQAWTLIRQQLQAGKQAYLVFPIIEESPKLSLKAVTSEFQKLQHNQLKDIRVALLHGKLKAAQRREIMENFRSGKIQVLASTTVIEVGVDVPNATVMAVFNPERFGLAQLHQLRGRVGRGADQSYFLLLADNTANDRLKILQSTFDGFKIAQEDLKLRGPGQLLGTEQHGMPAYKFANLVTDMELLYDAQRHAHAIVQRQWPMTPEQKRTLRRLLRHSASERTELMPVA